MDFIGGILNTGALSTVRTSKMPHIMIHIQAALALETTLGVTLVASGIAQPCLMPTLALPTITVLARVHITIDQRNMLVKSTAPP